MPDRQLSRRLWLGGSAAPFAAHWSEILAAQAHAHEAKEIEGIAGQIQRAAI